VDPQFSLTPEIAGTPTLVDVQAEKYFQAVRQYGSPAYTPSELVDAPDYGRRQADVVLSYALPISTATQVLAGGSRGPGRNCMTLPGGSNSELRVAPGVTRIELTPGPSASFGLRRFATGEYPVATDGTPGNSVTALRVPRDSAPQPWLLHVEASQRARVCR
jgi:hypothetical protein